METEESTFESGGEETDAEDQPAETSTPEEGGGDAGDGGSEGGEESAAV